MKKLINKACCALAVTLLVGTAQAQFTGQDIGYPTLPGSATENVDGTITITGGGSDMWDAADHGYFYSTPVAGLWWTVQMRIVSFDGPDAWSKVSLMARRPDPAVGTPQAGDPHMAIVNTRTAGQNLFDFQYRAARDGSSTEVANTPVLRPAYPNQWLRMTRSNTVFTVSYSTDGLNWTDFATQNSTALNGTPWEDPILVGVAVTAHNDSDLTGATAIVSNLVVDVHTITAPTALGVKTQIQSAVTAIANTEASFAFVATNNANPDFYVVNYAWYKNDVLVGTNMGPHYTFLTTLGDNDATIYAVASVQAPYESVPTVTSATATLTVNAGSEVFTNGLKQEFFAGATRQDVEIGNVGPGVVRLVSQADSAGGFGDIHARRYSGYFIPQTTDAYVFFIASDDDADLFLSTDSDPANKQLIAQEAGYSGTRSWLIAGGNGSLASQKRSDQWTNSVGEMPYTNGFYLTAGNRYYIESVMHNGGGGDNWAITYDLTNDLFSTTYDPDTLTYTNSSTFANGEPSRMTAASNNIAVITWPGTFLNWSLQPVASVDIYEGHNTNLSAIAVSDAEMAVVYQWYINDAPYSGATGTNLALLSIPASYNNAQFYAVATTEMGSITSSVSTFTVHQAVHELGFIKDERWNGKQVADIENNTVNPTPDFQMAVIEWGIGIDNQDVGRYDYARRVSGYFVPPTTANYVFYVTSDDDSDLFLSTDETAANKRQICRQDWWNTSAPWGWLEIPGWVSWTSTVHQEFVDQTRSSTWSPNGAGNSYKPWAGGIVLTQGQRYYIEQDMHQGGGGANLGVTFTYFGDADPTAGTETQLKGTNIEMSVNRCSYVTFTKQPANATGVVGMSVAFSADGTTDSQVTIGGPTGYEEDYASNYLFYQWFTNGVAVPGANFKKFLVGPVEADQTGMQVMCKARALGYTDDALNPIWLSSQTAILTVTARTPSLLGHWIGGTASLADSANYVAPGKYDGVAVTNGSHSFTSDVPPGAPSGAQSLHLAGSGIVISNTASSEAGYTVDTFDGNIQNQFTIAFWAKGSLNSWDPWVSKQGESAGWQVRKLGWSGDVLPTFTMRGAGGDGDPYPSLSSDTNNWHYYVGTFDTATGNRTLYLDGQLVNQQTGQTPYTLASGSRLVIGGRDNGGLGNYFTGDLYDVRIYNYALTQGEVAILGNSKPTFTSEITTDGVNQQLLITYPFGTLLQATNLMGPWTTNVTASPAYITIDPAQPQMFFRLQNP